MVLRGIRPFRGPPHLTGWDAYCFPYLDPSGDTPRWALAIVDLNRAKVFYMRIAEPSGIDCPPFAAE